MRIARMPDKGKEIRLPLANVRRVPLMSADLTENMNSAIRFKLFLMMVLLTCVNSFFL